MRSRNFRAASGGDAGPGSGRARGMWRQPALAVLTLATCASATGVGLELKPEAVAAFESSVHRIEGRMRAEISGSAPFLWIDRHPDEVRRHLLQRLQAGDVVSARLEPPADGTPLDVAGGLLHHWVGTVFLPGVTLERAAALVQDYERYPAVFNPTIQRARILSHEGDRFEVAMRTWTHKVIDVVLDADYRVDYQRLGSTRMFARSAASNIFEVSDAGTPRERRVPEAGAAGYLWRLNTYCFFDERPAGTYEQCESISLTRNIPWAVRFLVAPFVSGIPRETLEFTLGRVRQHLLAPRPRSAAEPPR